MSEFLVFLQELAVMAVVVGHVVPESQELDKDQEKMAFGYWSNLLYIVSELGEVENFFTVKHQLELVVQNLIDGKSDI